MIKNISNYEPLTDSQIVVVAKDFPVCSEKTIDSINATFKEKNCCFPRKIHKLKVRAEKLQTTIANLNTTNADLKVAEDNKDKDLLFGIIRGALQIALLAGTILGSIFISGGFTAILLGGLILYNLMAFYNMVPAGGLDSVEILPAGLFVGFVTPIICVYHNISMLEKDISILEKEKIEENQFINKKLEALRYFFSDEKKVKDLKDNIKSNGSLKESKRSLKELQNLEKFIKEFPKTIELSDKKSS